MTIGIDNTVDAMSLSVTSGNLSLMLGQTVVEALQHLEANSTLTFAGACSNGGSAQYSLSDRDGNGKVSMGDVLELSLSNCYLPSMGSVMGGTAIFSLSGAATTSGTRYVGEFAAGTNFRMISGAESITVKGMLQIDWRGNELDRTLTIQSSSLGDFGFVYDITLSGKRSIFTESLRELSLRKFSSRQRMAVEAQMAMVLRSELLEGSVRLSTPTVFMAYPDSLPSVGKFVVTGDASSRASLESKALTAWSSARLSLDNPVSGLTLITEDMNWNQWSLEYLWWNGGLLSGTGFDAAVATNQDLGKSFQLLTPSTSVTLTDQSVVPTLYLQFSKPLTIAQNLTFHFLRLDDASTRYDWGDAGIDAQVEQFGALVLVRPVKQLQHGRRYSLRPGSAPPSPPSGGQLIRDQTGQSIYFYALDLVTDVSLAAAITTQGVPLLAAGGSMRLQGSIPTVTPGTRFNYQWRQLSGPSLIITDANSASPLVSLASGVIGSPTRAQLQLEVQDERGQVEKAAIELALVPQAGSGTQLYLRARPFETILGRPSILVMEDMGTFNLFSNHLDRLVMYFTSLTYDIGSLNLNLMSANQQAIAVGPYEGAGIYPLQTVYPNGIEFSGTWRNCQNYFGRFDVLEINWDGNGNLSKVAVDFESSCDIGSRTVWGSLRFNSSLPLRP